mgnify:CR=1 FL=1
MPTYVYVSGASGEILYGDSNGQPQGIDAITWNGTNLAVGATMSVTGVATLGGTSAGELRLLEPSAGGTSYIALKAPALAANVTWTLPTADGTSGQFLKTNGSGTLSWDTISGGGDALTTNPLSQFASTTSAQLAGVISDETGTGALVFANTPTLVTPVLGTPTSGTLTNCTGLPISTGVSGLGTGVATFLATPSSANLASAVTDETGSGALMFGTSPTITTDITIPNTGLHLLDTDSSHDLILAPGSNLTADRTLTITTGDADRTLTISASATISGTNTGDVTLSGTPDYVTISGQIITVGLVDLTADVTGDLPLANLAQASAASKLLGRGSAAGAGDYQEITLGTGLSMSGTTLSSTGGSGSVATDTIWDAKGDLAVGTGADAAQKLTVGSDGKTIVADSTQTTGLAWKTRQTVVKDICGGRLSLESAVSVSSSDQSGKSTIYFVAHTSNEIALYDGTEWVPRTFNNISVAVPSTLFKVFDIFAYDNSGTVTLETTDWNQSTAAVTGATNPASPSPIVITTSASHGFSNGDLVGVASIGGNTAANGYIWEISSASGTSLTLVGSVGNSAYTSGGTVYKLTNTRATALTLQDGVLVKSGATTRRYLGTGMTGGTSGQMDDSLLKRMLYNYYNQIPRMVSVSYSTEHAYGTNSTRLMNLAAANKCWFVLGQPQDLLINIANSADGSLGAVGAAIDSTTLAIQEFMSTSSASLYTIGGAVGKQGQAIGGHFIALTQRGANSSSVTFCRFSITCKVFSVVLM